MCIFIIGLAVCVGIIINKQKEKNNVLTEEKLYKNTQKENTINDENEKIEETEEIQEEWKIEIPSISLTAPILEGTNQEILKKYVGHFELTTRTEGNVGLAAHNRGYSSSYFENLKNLKGGEEIIYTYNDFTKVYVVNKNIKISDTDWSHLENSNENKITLITCMENEPEYRRCVQATEKEEK